MSRPDTSTLAGYNSLTDPNLQSYFSSERIRSHLKHAGLMSGRGEVLSDGEYRTKLARREHQKHVRNMLAESIVNRAVDMERTRNAEMKRHYEIMGKAALVNEIKESRRRNGNGPGLMTNSDDLALLSLGSSWAQSRPRSANDQKEMYDEQQHRNSRVQSANVNGDQRMRHPSKTSNRRYRSLKRPKSSKRSRSQTKYPDATSSPPCQVTMVYYGPHTKVDYDHQVFADIDEIMVMQQHCGGENLVIYKNFLKPGDEFTFNSRRHADYPLGLSLYVKGLIDSRISTCCEYKHRHGVRLGGDRGHFAIVSVEGSKPCIKCRFEKQARLNKYAESPKEKNNESKKPITIPLPVSDEPKSKQTPVQIPVRHASMSTDNYSEDFDGSEKQKPSGRDGYSTDSSVKPSHTRQEKIKSSDSTPKVPPRASRVVRQETSQKSNATIDATSKPDSSKKTWQIIFHTSNVPTGNFVLGKNRSAKDFLLKFSFLANDGYDETESNEINMKPFAENSKSVGQHSFPIKLKNIGKPEQIRINIYPKKDDGHDDDDEEEYVKWHLDHIELIDPEIQSHLIFQCKQWIRPGQNKYLWLNQEYSQSERKRRTSASTNSSRSSSSNHKTRQQSPTMKQKPKTPSRSSIPTNSPKQSQTKLKSSHRSSSDRQSDDDSRRSSPKNKQTAKRSSPSPTASPKQSPANYKSSRGVSSDDENQELSPKLKQQVKTPIQLSTPTNSPKPIQTKSKSTRQTYSDDQSTDESRQESLKPKQKTKTPSLSPSSTNSARQSPTKHDLSRRISPDQNSKEHKIHYHVTIYPSNNKHGEFSPAIDSRIFLRLNNHSKDIYLTKRSDQTCPTFQSGVKQTFELDLIQDNDEQPKKLTIGYVNSEITAREWELEKIVLHNTETDEETTFPCRESLHRNESNFRAEKTFEVQLEESDGESTPRNPKRDSPKPNHKEEEEEVKTSKKPPINNNNHHQRSPSFQSMKDEDADYKTIFKQLDPSNDLKLGSPPKSPPLRPQTRRGRQDPTGQEHTHQPVEPLHGLDDLANQSARSSDQHNPSSLPLTTTENDKDRFQRLDPTSSDDDEDN